MATFRKWLNDLHFDWDTGTLIHQYGKIDEWGEWGQVVDAKVLGQDDPILDRSFDDGFGTYDCPRIIAKDKDALYIPSDYDGASSLEKIFLDLSKYLDFGMNNIPHLGGGG